MIAVIPARAGSKRILGKNLREFAGRPMMHWSIAAARDSGVFDRVIVSTEDETIAEQARAGGAEVPALRPLALADDYTPIAEVVAHAAEGFALEAEWICLIYATAPLLRPEILADAARHLQTLPDHAEYLVSVARHASPIRRALRFVGGRVEMIWPEHALTRSQDLEAAYFDAAQFAFGRRRAWPQCRLWGEQTYGYVVPRATAFDIDEPEDWEVVERLALATRFTPQAL